MVEVGSAAGHLIIVEVAAEVEEVDGEVVPSNAGEDILPEAVVVSAITETIAPGIEHINQYDSVRLI